MISKEVANRMVSNIKKFNHYAFLWRDAAFNCSPSRHVSEMCVKYYDDVNADSKVIGDELELISLDKVNKPTDFILQKLFMIQMVVRLEYNMDHDDSLSAKDRNKLGSEIRTILLAIDSCRNEMERAGYLNLQDAIDRLLE